MNHALPVIAALYTATLLGPGQALATDTAEGGSDEPASRILLLPLRGEHSPELEQAAALLDANLQRLLSDEGGKLGLELLGIEQLGSVAGLPAEAHLDRCPPDCVAICERRLGRLAGLDWVVAGTLREPSLDSRSVHIVMHDLRDALEEPTTLDYTLGITGHHETLADREHALLEAVVSDVLSVTQGEPDGQPCCVRGPTSADLSFFLAPIEMLGADGTRSRDPALEERLRSTFATSLRADLVRLELDELQEVTGYAPALFLASCPPGDGYQCALQAAQASGVGWAVWGVVQDSPREVGVRVLQLHFVSAHDPQVGEAVPSQEVILPHDDREAELLFFEQSVAAFEFFVRSELCSDACESNPALMVSAWLPSREIPRTPSEGGVQLISEYDPVTDTRIVLSAGGPSPHRRTAEEAPPELDDDLDELEKGGTDQGVGFSADRRGGELIAEGGLSFLHGSTGTVYLGEIVLEEERYDEALALGSYLMAERRPSASFALGLGLGINRRLDLALRGALLSAAYRQEITTREYDPWEEVMTSEQLDVDNDAQGFLAWQAQVALHLSLRRFRETIEEAVTAPPSLDSEPDTPIADEQLDLLDLEDEDALVGSQPPSTASAPSPSARLAPFLELGGGVFGLPLPAGHQTRMPTVLVPWSGFTWPTLRVALGLDYALGQQLDISLALPLYLHLGASSLTLEEGETSLLSVSDDWPTTNLELGLELMVRPRMSLRR